MRANDCPHGIPHEQRKRDGCNRCDADWHDARAFRARVVETARALLPSVVTVLASSDPEGTAAAPYAFMVAEAFERAADEYLKGGGK